MKFIYKLTICLLFCLFTITCFANANNVIYDKVLIKATDNSIFVFYPILSIAFSWAVLSTWLVDK